MVANTQASFCFYICLCVDRTWALIKVPLPFINDFGILNGANLSAILFCMSSWISCFISSELKVHFVIGANGLNCIGIILDCPKTYMNCIRFWVAKLKLSVNWIWIVLIAKCLYWSIDFFQNCLIIVSWVIFFLRIFQGNIPTCQTLLFWTACLL